AGRRPAAGGARRRRPGARRPARAGGAGGRLGRLLAVRASHPRRTAAPRLAQPAPPADARHRHTARRHHVRVRRRRPQLMEDFVSAPWLRRLLSVVLLGGIVLLGFRVLEPFIVPLVWAAILAFVTWPAYQNLLRAL